MAKYSVLVLGAGKIGSLISSLLGETDHYQITLGSLLNNDGEFESALPEGLNVTLVNLDVRQEAGLLKLFGKSSFDAVISALPYYCNPLVADVAEKFNVNYFDLTEDVSVTQHVKKLSQGKETVFMPQCGLAPGFISIAANDLMVRFDSIDTVKMRVGALPVNPNNVLKYSLTWSTDGLINEYGNTCYGIDNGKLTTLLPLEGLESITLDGVLYEAFNTSGGLGTLAETYAGKVRTMDYKTLRYPGHCENIKLLMHDLRLNEDRETLKRILERAVPKTYQDVVLVYVAVSGYQYGEFIEENYVRKIYPQTISGKLWSSIQVTTAAAICSVVDLVLSNQDHYSGFITQEQISLEEVLNNRFGKYYDVDRRL